MGSGFSGRYRGTYSSEEGEELRRLVLEAIERAGGLLVGDSVVELAEALVAIATGVPADEAGFPEPGDVAFDLALDALSAFLPGGGQATRALGMAAKAGKDVGRTERAVARATDGAEAASRPFRTIRMGRRETAIVMSALNGMYHTRLKKGKTQVVPIRNCIYTVVVHDFGTYSIIGREVIE